MHLLTLTDRVIQPGDPVVTEMGRAAEYTIAVLLAVEDMAAMAAGGAIPAPTAAAVTVMRLTPQIPGHQVGMALIITVADLSGLMCKTY